MKKVFKPYEWMLTDTLLISVSFPLSVNAEAKVKLPSVLADNMVLQQQTDVKLWGQAQAKATLTVKTSWNNKHIRLSLTIKAYGNYRSPLHRRVALTR